MITPDVQDLVAQLQRALGESIVCGTLSLNLNAGRLESWRTETYKRVWSQKSLDDGFTRRVS